MKSDYMQENNLYLCLSQFSPYFWVVFCSHIFFNQQSILLGLFIRVHSCQQGEQAKCSELFLVHFSSSTETVKRLHYTSLNLIHVHFIEIFPRLFSILLFIPLVIVMSNIFIHFFLITQVFPRRNNQQFIFHCPIYCKCGSVIENAVIHLHLVLTLQHTITIYSGINLLFLWRNTVI